VGASTIQHPGCLAISDLPDPVRGGGHLWLQYESPLRFTVMFSDLPAVGNTDEELCNRWMTLSAYLPFFRNHNILSAIPQEPYVWDSVADASRDNIAVRYSLLPYWVSAASVGGISPGSLAHDHGVFSSTRCSQTPQGTGLPPSRHSFTSSQVNGSCSLSTGNS
jgi:hypothetical protein